MDRRLLISLLALAVMHLAGCMKDSKLYCDKHGAEDPATCGYLDAAIDARPMCGTDMDCSGRAPFCEPSSHYCVECLDNSSCTVAEKPFCDLSTYTCEGCVTNADCPSKVCLPTGVCGDDSNTAYVDPASGNHTACTFAQPCMLVADALATGRPNVKVTGMVSEAVTIMGKVVTIIGDPGTTITKPTGVIIIVMGGSDVSIYDVRVVGVADKGITNAMSTLRLYRVSVTGGPNMDKPAIESKGGTLIMSRCNVYGYLGGGISVDAAGAFNLTNNIIVHNGNGAANTGGVSLAATTSGQNRFELNTVADNNVKAGAGNAGGVACSALGLTIRNNIIARNASGGDPGALQANTLATLNCSNGNSSVATDVAAYKFVMPEGAGPSWDYHIQPGSSAIDAASTSDIGIDIDGNIRPQGAGVDLGADELKQ